MRRLKLLLLMLDTVSSSYIYLQAIQTLRPCCDEATSVECLTLPPVVLAGPLRMPHYSLGENSVLLVK